MRSSAALLAFVFLILGSCSSEEIIEERYYPRNDHEAYLFSLKQANLLSTALGKEWLNASKRPFSNQIAIEFPYQESFDLSNTLPEANGYRFEAKRGQKILVNIELLSNDTTRVFVDLFRVVNDSLHEYRQVASADSTLDIIFQPRRDAAYLLRLQPELLRGGKYSITIENQPSLAFPVVGKDKNSIGSVFGDPRDGGRRKHHGVDIFAPRHTPIVAPVSAHVSFVGTRGIGGKVVWLRDQKTGNSLYFAHLQEQNVKRYQRVNPGDTIGTVGNTGNARTTPPHLHFGIYNNGPMDPYRFIVPEYAFAKEEIADTSKLGQQLRADRKLFLRSQMFIEAEILDTLIIGELLQLKAINHQFVRVQTQNGKQGFLRKDALSRF